MTNPPPPRASKVRGSERVQLRSDFDSFHTVTSGRIGAVARLPFRETPPAQGSRRNPGRRRAGAGSGGPIAIRFGADGSHETTRKHFEFCLLAWLAAADVPLGRGNPPTVLA